MATRSSKPPKVLLFEIAANPHARVWEVPVLSDAARDQLMVARNEAGWTGAEPGCVHEVFEEQVERRSESIAVVAHNHHYTYGFLNRRANQLARYLRRLGVRADTRVGIYLERSWEMLVGILAILKAGGAYVPLDQSYPYERLRSMVIDCELLVLLTKKSLAHRWDAHLDRSCRRVLVDKDRPQIAMQQTNNLESKTHDLNLAYVIYTSGSTGRPKGVSISHTAVKRLVLNTDYVAFSSSDRVAQASTATFDAATFEIWGALLHGAALVLVDTEVLLAPKSLARDIAEHDISTMFVTTALFNQFASEMPFVFGSVRDLFVGGEAMNPDSAKRVLEHNPPRRLVNAYGPTEATTFASWYSVESVPQDATTVPIGRPISNMYAHILDDDLDLVPAGAVGHLHLGGSGLARGYYGQPSLTADKFIPDPLSDVAGARLYRTGDLCRRLLDGHLEFCGRIDRQVKIRGYRIEPGEIEVLLREQASVEQAMVQVTKARGHERLVAYLVHGSNDKPNVDEIREYLRHRLPRYMVPLDYVVLESLPLTANGKIDWAVLPSCHDPVEVEHFVAPSTQIEMRLAEIWQDVLKVRRVSVDTSFFDAGGNSVLLTELYGQLADEFSREFALLELFRYPTIRDFASFLVDVPSTDRAEKGRERGRERRASSIRRGRAPSDRE